jgi:hypothetical protein
VFPRAINKEQHNLFLLNIVLENVEKYSSHLPVFVKIIQDWQTFKMERSMLSLMSFYKDFITEKNFRAKLQGNGVTVLS